MPSLHRQPAHQQRPACMRCCVMFARSSAHVKPSDPRSSSSGSTRTRKTSAAATLSA